MGDEFNGCECVWSPEIAMQRLLNFIRQNQDHCTDTECIDVSGRVAPQNDSLATMGNDSGNSYLMVTICLALAVIMFFIRPETVMNLTGTKPRPQARHDNNDDASPPPPPPAVN